jgi:hypothetical protein
VSAEGRAATEEYERGAGGDFGGAVCRGVGQQTATGARKAWDVGVRGEIVTMNNLRGTHPLLIEHSFLQTFDIDNILIVTCLNHINLIVCLE